MTIHGTQLRSIASPPPDTVQKRPDGAAAPASVRAPAADRVQVSCTAARLAPQDNEPVDAEAAADPERLKELKEALSSGRYPIDPTELAGRILGEDAISLRQPRSR
jgi:flagellar biosynthesis anti-sigma factor FlgM